MIQTYNIHAKQTTKQINRNQATLLFEGTKF
uniref:Uncharacterized protein n=1 Tax=Populus trichocarpa TaxID=3694 RepID=A0A3N7G5N7_POPTR